jgi:hypothetical protein
MHRKFCAAAEMSNVDVALPPWSCCPMRYALVRLSREFTMGTNTPAARAVVDGIAGDKTVSAACKPYASDSVVLPKALTKSRPRRSPKPVL